MSRVAAAGAERERRPAEGAGTRRFAVLDRQTLAARRTSRRARVVAALAGLVVAGALGAVAASQSLVASQQVRLDGARQQLATAVAQQEQLLSTRARLAAPARVLQIAEADLHMVSPTQVTYLSPVPVGPTLGGRGPAVHTGATGTLQLAAPAKQHHRATSR